MSKKVIIKAPETSPQEKVLTFSAWPDIQPSLTALYANNTSMYLVRVYDGILYTTQLPSIDMIQSVIDFNPGLILLSSDYKDTVDGFKMDYAGLDIYGNYNVRKVETGELNAVEAPALNHVSNAEFLPEECNQYIQLNSKQRVQEVVTA